MEEIGGIYNKCLYGRDYYIHWHQENIGKCFGSQIKDSEITRIFKSRKKQASELAKFNYKALFRKNIISQNGMQLMELGLDDNKMDEINKKLVSDFEQRFNSQGLESFMRIVQTQPLDYKKFLSQKYRKNELDRLLDIIIQGLDIIQSNNSSALAASLISIKLKKDSYIKKIEGLNKILQQFKNKNGTIIGTQGDIEHFVNQLNTVFNRLATLNDSTQEGLSSEGIKKLIENNLFSTGFGELLASKIQDIAENSILESVLTGKDLYQQQGYSDQGRHFILKRTTQSQGKVDIKAKNYSFTIDDKGNALIIDLGISNKFYKSLNFKNVKPGKVGAISSGSGGSLGDAIMLAFSTEKEKYLAYNVFAHEDKKEVFNSLFALQDVLLTRQIVSLFGSRGGAKDFSQLLLINNEIVSLWEIVQYVVQNAVGYSTSLRSKQPVSISISGRKDIEEANSVYREKVMDRVSAVNNAINKATIKATLHVNRIKELRRLNI